MGGRKFHAPTSTFAGQANSSLSVGDEVETTVMNKISPRATVSKADQRREMKANTVPNGEPTGASGYGLTWFCFISHVYVFTEVTSSC